MKLEINNLSKVYPNGAGINDISFTIEDHGVYGLLGNNGAGKSTFMNCLTGYLASSSGSATINGFDILKDAEKAKSQFGYLPEIPPVYNDMTVDEYLMFCAELKKISKDKRAEAVADVKEKAKLNDVAGRLINNLSKGYKQRVGLAQAILGYPELIILDEPSVGLDPEQIIEMREFIASLKKDHTVILSSHILSEVQAICDYVFIINNGKLICKDSVENLSERYNTSSLEDIFLEITHEAMKEAEREAAEREAAENEAENEAIEKEMQEALDEETDNEEASDDLASKED